MICVIGLGYVGLPLANAFAMRYNVIGIDINENRIKDLNGFNDQTLELSSDELKRTIGRSLHIFSDIYKAKHCKIFIVTVPTPVTSSKQPDLSPVINATKSVATILKKDDIIIFESTVYPGATEEVCVPILEKESGLLFNKDFFVGYSPERINPGDKKHTITKIKKVVSGSTIATTKKISELYLSIIEAGVYQAESIKVAEAAKVIENTQRDINIAFINELSVIFNRMGIDTNEVLNAAATKWNFLRFSPGLVGGHCIGVDPYYLAFKAQEFGYSPEMILSGRRINDDMPMQIVTRVIQSLLTKSINRPSKTALILGATFKEDCPDVRNSKVKDIYTSLLKYSIVTKVYDPVASIDELKVLYSGSVISNLKEGFKFDIIIIAVSHSEFLNLDIEKMSHSESVIFDVKALFPKSKGYLRL
ncbi:nucleotide sugar dehydrogenase [Flavobacteriaceae bacterium]|nr:nucleotide sugar dehydrogenase [Flavobacteriaceae bacterium]